MVFCRFVLVYLATNLAGTGRKGGAGVEIRNIVGI